MLHTQCQRVSLSRCLPMASSARVCIPPGLRPARSCICPSSSCRKNASLPCGKHLSRCSPTPGHGLRPARVGWPLPRSCALRAVGLQPDALSSQPSLSSEWVLLWAKPSATRRVTAMQLSPPVRVMRWAIRLGGAIELAQRRRWQVRLQT
jgi:hypothetical protein